jgi:hypothetical protein
MTRRRKFLLFLVAGPCLLLGVLIAALCMSAVQTFVARKVLAGQGGDVDRVELGLKATTVTGLRLEQPGLKISAPSMAVELPLWDLAGGEIDVRGLAARDLVIEFDPAIYGAHAASRPGTAVEAKAPAPFAGLLRAVALPAQMKVNDLELAGVFHLRGAMSAEIRFEAGIDEIGAAGEGKVRLLMWSTNKEAGDVRVEARLRPTLDTAGQLEALALEIAMAASGGELTPAAALGIAASVAREGAGESYRLSVTDAGGVRKLVELDTRWSPDTALAPGAWKLALSDADLTPFLPASVVAPKLNISGEGEIVLAGPERVRVSGSLEVLADALERLGLPALGPVSIASRFAVENSATRLSVDAFSLSLAAGVEPVLNIEARQSFSFESASGRVVAARAEEPLIEMKLLGLPNAWWRDYAPELSLAAPVTAAFTARSSGAGFVIESSAPLVLSGVRYADLAVFDAIRVDGVRVAQDATGLDVAVGSVRVIAGGDAVVAGEVGAGRKTGEPDRARATFKFDLAKLANQPALRGKTRIAAGEATLTFDAALDEATRGSLSLQVGGLRAAGVTTALPVFDLKADVTRDKAGVVTLKVPVNVINSAPARRSDLELNATLTRGETDTDVRAKLSSRELHMPDLQLFGALAADAPPAAPGTGPASPPAAAKDAPLWAGYSGRVDIDLARIVHAPGIEFTNTKGSIAITREALSLEKIKTLLGTGGSVDLSGVLSWLAKSRSYAMAADVDGRDVKVGPLLKAINPAASPALEGTYSLAGKAAGQGTDPAAAIGAAAGEFRLTGKQGMLRAINLDTNRYAQAGNVVAGLAGILAARSGNTQLGERAAQVAALNAVARRLGNLAYDEIVVEARRDADGSVEVGELRLSGADARLAGSGKIRALPGRGFAQQPLTLTLDLAAGGDFARELAVLRVLKPAAEDAPSDAFRGLTQPLTFDGTLEKIGTAQVVRFLTQALGL